MQKLIPQDQAGRNGYYGIFSEQLATDRTHSIMAQFSYGLSDFDLDLENQVELNGGSISIQDSNLLTASAGTNIEGQASVQSEDKIRYRAGCTCIAQLTAQFSNYENDDSEAWIWPFNGTNWYRIWYEDGVFKFQVMKDGVITQTASSPSFNNGKSEDKDIDYYYKQLNPEALNIYRITYGYLGSAPATLEVLGKNEVSRYPLHTFTFNDTPWTNIEVPYLPIQLKAINTGANSNISVSTASIQAGVMWQDVTTSTRYFQDNREFITC